MLSSTTNVLLALWKKKMKTAGRLTTESRSREKVHPTVHTFSRNAEQPSLPGVRLSQQSGGKNTMQRYFLLPYIHYVGQQQNR
jgi:hypothetical protein